MALWVMQSRRRLLPISLPPSLSLFPSHTHYISLTHKHTVSLCLPLSVRAPGVQGRLRSMQFRRFPPGDKILVGRLHALSALDPIGTISPGFSAKSHRDYVAWVWQRRRPDAGICPPPIPPRPALWGLVCGPGLGSLYEMCFN